MYSSMVIRMHLTWDCLHASQQCCLHLIEPQMKGIAYVRVTASRYAFNHTSASPTCLASVITLGYIALCACQQQ